MDNFNDGSKKKKSGGLLVVFLLIIIAVAAGAGYYFLKISKPKYVFEKAIDGFLSSDVTTTDDITKYKTAKLKADVTAKVNSDDEDIKVVSDLLNDAKLTFTTEIDFENKEDVVGVKLVKSKEDLLDAKVKVEEESQKAYLDLGEFFGKIIKVDIEEVLEDEIKAEDTGVSSIGQMISELKAKQIAKDEIKSQLKEEYFSADKASVDGVNLTRNELKVSEKEFLEIVKNICNDLANNDEFLSCYEDKDSVKDSLKDVVEKVNDIETDKDTYIIIDIYTSGIMKNVERVDFSVDDGDEKISIQFTEKGDDQLTYKVVQDDKTELEGDLKVKFNENDFVFEISMKNEEIEVSLSINGTMVYDEELDKFDTKNAVDINEISMEDYYEIMGNLSESKLYQIIEEITGSSDSDSYLYDEEDEDSDDEDDDDEEEQEDNEEDEY